MLRMLWTGEYNEEWEHRFQEQFEITRAGMNCAKHMFTDVYTDSKEDEEALCGLLKEKDIYLVGYDRVTRSLLDRCPDLKLILCVRDGPEENIDIQACTEKGIPVIFSGGRCAHAVAEFNILLMLLMARPILPIMEIIQQQGWTKENHEHLNDIDSFATELYGKKLHIIGMGRNGIMLAKKAAGLGMKVLGSDPYADPQRMKALGVQLVEMEEGLKEADYVTLLARVTEETMRMFARDQIELMKPSACLINTGRAKLAVTEDIFDALQRRRIRMVAMDIFDVEPLGRGEVRAYDFKTDQLIVTPHIAGYTQERIPHEYELLSESLEKYFRGDKEINVKNPEVFQTQAYQQRGAQLCGMESAVKEHV